VVVIVVVAVAGVAVNKITIPKLLFVGLQISELDTVSSVLHYNGNAILVSYSAEHRKSHRS
jgi:hypothetical protein